MTADKLIMEHLSNIVSFFFLPNLYMTLFQGRDIYNIGRNRH